MPRRKKIKSLFKEGDKPIKAARIDLGKTKTLTKSKWQRQKRDDGRDGGFVTQEKVIEDQCGAKWKRKSIRTADDAVGGTKDLAEASRRERGYYALGQSGKGDAPRSTGPEFHENFKKIKGMKKRKDGVVGGGKWKKTYK
jgi:hypothetical protein